MCEFLAEIKELHEKSTLNEIIRYLKYDIRKLAKLKENANITLKYECSEVECLNNWLRYRIATKQRLYINNFDCDTTTEVKEILKTLLETNVNAIEYDGGRIYTINEKIELETDTINSFATTFNKFMRHILEKIESDWVNNYIEKYKCNKPSDPYRDTYFLENINSWYKQMTDVDKETFNQLKKLSVYAHTIGNFTLVPKGYNIERSSKTQDYWDLSLIYLQKNRFKNGFENRSEYENFKWYTKNYNLFDLDTYFYKKTNEYSLEDNEVILFTSNSNSKGIKRCASNMELHIKIRGLEMLKKLNSKLIGNDAFNKYYEELVKTRNELINR